jgi:hypothetical protein
MKKILLTLIVLLASGTVTNAENLKIGEIEALIPEASTAYNNKIQLVDGGSGDLDFPFIDKIKPIATVGEVNKFRNDEALTGYPDGNAAWLHDNNTVRVAYQSESYATMSSETYPWEMNSGATFTGSHIHTIDYDREKFAEFLNNNEAASGMVINSGKLFDTIYNQFGEVVKAKADGGLWGNQTLPNKQLINFNDKYSLTKADFFFQSFCGAWYEQANRYGQGIGFADNIWLTAEEWNINRMFENTNYTSDDTLGLASIAVDVKNRTAYTVPALGQSGYEKIMPVNSKHKDFVVMVLAGYNHGVEPAPLKIYVGKKNVGINGKPLAENASERDKFLGRNGLLYGKIYGMALANGDFAKLGINKIDLSTKMLDDYLKDPNSINNFNVRFYPTSYQWKGWDKTPAVKNTEVNLWGNQSEQPKGYTFLVGDSKTEHPAVDPDINNQRYLQNMTQEGGLIGVELTNFVDEIQKTFFGNSDLPQYVSAKVTKIVGAHDGSLTLVTADKGLKHSGGDHSTWEDGKAKMVAPDGLHWSKTSDGDILIVDEDSGNKEGERKYLLVLDDKKMELMNPNEGYFLAMAGGKKNPRAVAETAVYPGSFSKATSSEFSGSWNITALLAKDENGKFYSMDDLAGVNYEKINQSTSLSDSVFLGVVQHKGESGGFLKKIGADNGGQIFIYKMNLPSGAMVKRSPSETLKLASN